MGRSDPKAGVQRLTPTPLQSLLSTPLLGGRTEEVGMQSLRGAGLLHCAC